MRRSGARLGSPSRTRLLWTVLLVVAAVGVLGGCAANRRTASETWSGVASDDGFAYVGTSDGRLIQLTADGGVPVSPPFQVPSEGRDGGSLAFYGTPTVADGRVYMAGYNGFVYSMDAAGLGEVRTFEVDGNPLAKGVAGSAVPAGRVVVVAAAEDAGAGRLYVLDAESLVERCRYPQRGLPPAGQIWSTPLVLNGIAYFGDLAHRVHAVSTDDCSLVWGEPAELGGAVVAPPIVISGRLYVGAFDRWFYAIGVRAGGVSPLFKAGGWFWGAAVADGTRVYVPNLDGRVYAYETAEGRVVWSYPEEGDTEPILSAPIVAGNQLVYGSDSGSITVVGTRDGGFEWDRKVGDKVRAPLTVSEGVVFVHALDGTVSAIDLRTKQLVWARDLDDVK